MKELRILLVPALLVSLACRTSPPPRYYLLDAGNAAVSAAGGDREGAVGIGPITFPRYLERPQIVSRHGSELELAELHRWAEPLADHFAATLGEAVAARTGSPRVHVFPWPPSLEIDLRLGADVSRFDVDRDGRAVLTVRWQIADDDGNLVVPPRRSSYSRAAAGAEPVDHVAALSATLAAFADDVVEALEPIALISRP